MSAAAAEDGPALALCGSNVDGATAFSAAVRRGGEVVLELPAADERGDLAVLARRALARAGVAARDLREVRVDRGPGSYIGLRVAVTTARILAAFAPARLLVADSLALAAAAADAPDGPARRCPVLDGRQGRLQFAAFAAAPDGRLETAHRATLLADADLGAALRPGDALLAAPPLHGRLSAAATAAGATLLPMPRVTAAALFAPALSLEEQAAEAVEPLYLTGSYAS
ncbi:MAG: tRNA (adenosine(37)-N6)-threonylcarbamoyltransferase complex dimerization subunit type 1 TsaB [Planctomycetota bacterium]